MNVLAHWELKVVAMVLAVALWIYTSGQARTEKGVDVHLRDASVIGLGDNYQITSISPSDFHVTLSVPSTRWDEFRLDALSPRLEVRQDALKARSQSFTITSAVLGLNSDVRILRIDPENVRDIVVSWDYIVEDDLPIEAPPLENVPAGLTASLTPTVTMVRVRAANDIIERERQLKQRVHFQPINLGFVDPTAAANVEHRVELRPANGQPYRVQQRVMGVVVLKPIPSSMLISGLPVNVLLEGESIGRYRAELDPPQVTVLLHGPENMLKALKPITDLTAYVDVRGGPEFGVVHEQPLGIIAPPWLTFDPVTVRLTVRLPLPPEAVATPAKEVAPLEVGPVESTPVAPAGESSQPVLGPLAPEAPSVEPPPTSATAASASPEALTP